MSSQYYSRRIRVLEDFVNGQGYQPGRIVAVLEEKG